MPSIILSGPQATCGHDHVCTPGSNPKHLRVVRQRVTDGGVKLNIHAEFPVFADMEFDWYKIHTMLPDMHDWFAAHDESADQTTQEYLSSHPLSVLEGTLDD